jgi:hypothetical protein
MNEQRLMTDDTTDATATCPYCKNQVRMGEPHYCPDVFRDELPPAPDIGPDGELGIRILAPVTMEEVRIAHIELESITDNLESLASSMARLAAVSEQALEVLKAIKRKQNL